MRAVSNRFKTDNNDFIRLEHNSAYFRLLLETAPDGNAASNKNKDRKFTTYPGHASGYR